MVRESFENIQDDEKNEKKNVESRYLYKINNITVKLLFLSFFVLG